MIFENLLDYSASRRGRSRATADIKASDQRTHCFRPLEDARWDGFLASHPQSSVFHTSAWLEALQQTYGYEPVAFTTSHPGGPLENAVVFCRVNSWLTGRRLVSLPFSDCCEPLVTCPADWEAISLALEAQLRREKLHYIELRPVTRFSFEGALFPRSHAYCRHQIDLTSDLDRLFANCHKDSTQRKIQRARRERLVYEEGRSEALLNVFYGLQVMTRRRHQIPPQPRRWFANLISCFGEDLKIRVAIKDKKPVASILTIRYKDTLLYKYGCSNAEFSNLGGMHFLLWLSIEEGKRDDLRVLDLGRSDYEGKGLITFKDRWGSVRSEFVYTRLSTSRSKSNDASGARDRCEQIAKSAVSRLPDPIFRALGDVLYRHIG
jgi:hypothetical protein